MNITINTDDPNAIAGHIWANTPDNAERTRYRGVEGQSATVTVGTLELSVGYSPHEDGILWVINYLDSDGTRDIIKSGGWAPGDNVTAEREIASILYTLNQAGH